MKKPLVSGILPVYNGEKYVSLAIKSILSQSFKNFELIIIDDFSTDNSLEIISSYKDKRIKIIRNKKNIGVAKSLNKALKKVQGDYVARFDADDINFKNRLQKQVQFLDKNLDYVLVGSRFKLIDGNGKELVERKIRPGYQNLPLSDQDIRKELLIRNPISHPSVMIRKKVFDNVGGYRTFFNGAEDYELWFRLSKIGKLCNLKKPLIKRRIHKQAVTLKKHIKIEILAMVVRLLNLQNIIKN